MTMPDEQQIVPQPKVKINGKKHNNRAEGIVYNYFREKGYSVVLGRYISDEIGAPDFLVEKDKEKFWVEVKTIMGSLSCEQLLWMAKYPEDDVFIAIPREGAGPHTIRVLSIKVVECNA